MPQSTGSFSASGLAPAAGQGPQQRMPSSTSSGPVGRGNYEVRPGDCIESIAFSHGHFWQTIWNDIQNLQLRNARKNPNIMLPGDKVFVPEIQIKHESCVTGRRHKFVRRGVPSKLSILLKDEKGQPRADLEYVLVIDGMIFNGRTDGTGRIQHPIPPNAQWGKLSIGTEGEEYPLKLGYMDPISEISGVQARLSNLGYTCGQPSDKLNEETRQALRDFQDKHQLKQTGEPDQTTCDKLIQEHGS